MRLSSRIPCGLLAALALAMTSPAKAQVSGGSIVSPEMQALDRRLLVEDFQRGAYGPVTAARLDQVKAGGAIPIFESLFPQAKDHDVKARIARELVIRKVQNPIYWDYLLQLAKRALELDIPEFELNDPSVPYPTPGMREWARQHPGADFNLLTARWSQQLSDFDIMATSGDSRSLPILRKALASPNRETRDAAAGALAQDHDTASIPAIIELTHHVTPNEQHSLARTLLTFEDPAATAAAKAILPPKPNPLDELRKGEPSGYMYNVEQIVTNHQVEAIPFLKSEFLRTKDEDQKDKLASALIRFHDPDPIYWNFLYERARAVIESGAPPPFNVDAKGNPTTVSSEYIAWAETHHASSAPEDIMFKIAGSVLELAETADPRSIPLLREGLHSNYPLVAPTSLRGLERVHAPGIIEYVVDECTRHPAEATNLAMQLFQFDDDPKAEQAAARFLSPELLADLKKQRAAKP